MNIQMIVFDPNNLSIGDQSVYNHFESKGHSIIVSANADPIDSSTELLVLMRSVGGSSSSGFDYSHATMPVLCLGRGFTQGMGYGTGSLAGGSGVTDMSPYGDAHPTHLGYESSVTVLSSAATNWRRPDGTTLIPSWTYYSSNYCVLYAEPDQELLDNKTAISRHLWWGFNSDGDIANLNTDGWSIFDGFVDWLAPSTTPTQFFEDFSNTPLGLGVPDGMTVVTESWDGLIDVEVIEDASLGEGRFLYAKITPTETYENSTVFMLDESGYEQVNDVIVRTTVRGWTNDQIGVSIRASLDAPPREWSFFNIHSDGARIRTTSNSSVVLHGGDYSEYEWVYFRLWLTGTQMRGATSNVLEDVLGENPVAELSFSPQYLGPEEGFAGWWMRSSNNGGEKYLDWISVGTHGSPAPTGPVDTGLRGPNGGILRTINGGVLRSTSS